jgi:hypothetical protein
MRAPPARAGAAAQFTRPINGSATIAAHAATLGWQKRLEVPMLRVFEMVSASMTTFVLAWAILRLTGRRAR